MQMFRITDIPIYFERKEDEKVFGKSHQIFC